MLTDVGSLNDLRLRPEVLRGGLSALGEMGILPGLTFMVGDRGGNLKPGY